MLSQVRILRTYFSTLIYTLLTKLKKVKENLHLSRSFTLMYEYLGPSVQVQSPRAFVSLDGSVPGEFSPADRPTSEYKDAVDR